MGSLLLSLLLSVAHGSTLIEDVQAQLAKKQNINGTFKQTRFVKQMAVTLNSSGNFQLDKAKGLAWSQTEPFEYKFKVDGDRIELVNKDSAPQVITKESQPMLFAFSQTFLALFSGDMSALNKQFEVKSAGTKQKWNFDLVPRDESTRRAVKGLNVSGGSAVDHVRVEDSQGNTMTIEFQLAKEAR